MLFRSNNILVWRDPWVPDLPSFSPLPCDQEDKWIWLKSDYSEFTVKSMYNSEFIVKSMYKVVAPLEPALHQSPLMGKIWKLCIHDRLKMFLWRLASNLLPTKESLPRFANNVDISCNLYGGFVEFVTHLFRDYSFARDL